MALSSLHRHRSPARASRAGGTPDVAARDDRRDADAVRGDTARPRITRRREASKPCTPLPRHVGRRATSRARTRPRRPRRPIRAHRRAVESGAHRRRTRATSIAISAETLTFFGSSPTCTSSSSSRRRLVHRDPRAVPARQKARIASKPIRMARRRRQQASAGDGDAAQEPAAVRQASRRCAWTITRSSSAPTAAPTWS